MTRTGFRLAGEVAMRQWLIPFLSLVAILAVPAKADVKATYRLGRVPAQITATMTVEAADNGAARIDMQGPALGARTGIITPAGELFMILPLPDGIAVARMADMMTLMSDFMAKELPGRTLDPGPPDQRRLEERERVTVAGHAGIRYVEVDPEQSDRPSGLDLVFSTDPALAPIGRASVHGLRLMQGAAMFGSVAPSTRQIIALSQKSALLRMGDLLELVSVEHGPIDPARFELPAEPLSRDQLRALMTEGFKPRTGGAGEPAG